MATDRAEVFALQLSGIDEQLVGAAYSRLSSEHESRAATAALSHNQTARSVAHRRPPFHRARLFTSSRDLQLLAEASSPVCRNPAALF